MLRQAFDDHLQQDRQLLLGGEGGRRPHSDGEGEHPAGRSQENLDGKAQRRLSLHLGKEQGEHRRVPRGAI